MHIKLAAKYPSGTKLLRPSLLAVGQLALFIVIAIGLLWPAPFVAGQLPSGWLNSDLTISHWPTALLIQRTFAQEHRLPLWNPYYGGGQPLGADPLAALFYPPTHLVHIFSLRDYYLVIMIGHLVLAGLGTLLLARSVLRLPYLPALVAAISFMATPRLISHLGAGHITMLQTIAWYPWLALTCSMTVQQPRRWGALLGICVGMTLLAGHPQMAYYGLLMTAGLAVWLLVKRWRQTDWRCLLISATGLAAAAGTGVSLAAIHLLPLIEFTALSTRQLALNSPDTYPLLDFLRELINQQARAQLPWEGIVTPGLAVLALALLAVVTRWHKSWPLALGAVLIAGLAMGNSSWFYLLVIHFLPGLERFRVQVRTWFAGLLICSLLAGIGTDALLHIVRCFSACAAMVASYLLVFIVTLTLLITTSGYARSSNVNSFTTPSALASTAAQLAGSGRVYGVQRNISQVSAVQLQSRLADGWNPLLIWSYVSYMHRAGGYTAEGYQLTVPAYPSDSFIPTPDARLLGLMHVSVVVSLTPLTDPRFVKIGEVNGTLIYKNTADAGPGYLVKANRNPPSLDQVQLLDSNVRTITQTPEVYGFTFSNREDAYFVVATPAFPGWQAELDGHPVTVQQIAGVLPAIKVSPGTHQLRYVYAPSSVYLGASISGISLLLALAWLVGGRYLRRGQYPRQKKEE